MSGDRHGKGNPGEKGPYAKLGEIIFDYAMDSVGEIVPFDLKGDVEQQEFEETVAVTIQTCMLFFDKLSGTKGLNVNLLNDAYKLFQEEKFEEVDELLFGDEE